MTIERKQVSITPKEMKEQFKEDFAREQATIKEVRRENLYEKLEGDLKPSVCKLGVQILEKKQGSAYKLLLAYLNRQAIRTNTGDIAQIKKNLENNKADRFLLAGILQAGAIQCCDKADVLRNFQTYLGENTDAKKTFAVDGDPRSNTMLTLMAIYEDKVINKIFTRDDGNLTNGMPSVAFIESMTADVTNSQVTDLTETDKEEINKSKPRKKMETIVLTDPSLLSEKAKEIAQKMERWMISLVPELQFEITGTNGKKATLLMTKPNTLTLEMKGAAAGVTVLKTAGTWTYNEVTKQIGFNINKTGQRMFPSIESVLKSLIS